MPSGQKHYHTILLAEDDQEMRCYLKESFIKKGYEVIECINGQQLIKYLSLLSDELIKADLILTDDRMPGIGGMEILSKIKSVLSTFPPIILITAFGNSKIHNRAKSMGVKEILDKPILFENLLPHVEKHIKRYNTLQIERFF